MSLENQIKNDKEVSTKSEILGYNLASIFILGGAAAGVYLGENLNEDIRFLKEWKETIPIIRYCIDIGTASIGAACTSAMTMVYYTIKNMDW